MLEINTPEVQTESNFCGECGLSLKIIEPFCQSVNCQKCDRRIYFQRLAPEGGFRVEKGEQVHVTIPTITLDPMEGGRQNQLTREGLEGVLRNLMTDGGFENHTNFLDYCRKREQELDTELSSLDYLNHIDLSDPKQVDEALEILIREDADEYRMKLLTSSFLNAVHTKSVAGDSENAAMAAFRAALCFNLQLFSNPHYKEIIWLGYQVYVDLKHNSGLSSDEAREKLLLDQVAMKLKGFSDPHLLSLSKADSPISVPLGVKGVRENGLKALLEHEVERRKKANDEDLKRREIAVKEREYSLKKWGFIITLVNVVSGITIAWLSLGK
jgi:hypothetical protein